MGAAAPILVCGPERSGTTPLTRFLAAAGLDVEHRSYPEGGWWPPRGRYTAVVAVTRWMPDVIAAQVDRRFQPDARAAASHIGLARRLIAEQYADHPCYLEVTYEALAHPAARGDLARMLGADQATGDHAVHTFAWQPVGVLTRTTTGVRQDPVVGAAAAAHRSRAAG